MSFEALAKEAAQRARGERAMVTVPEVDEVVQKRRAHHRARNAVIGGVAVAVMVAGIGSAVALRGGSESHSLIVTSPQHTPPVEFRRVLGELPYASPPGGPADSRAQTCINGELVTPPEKVTFANQIILPDRKHKTCFILGPTLLTGKSISKIHVSLDATGSWEINTHFANDDFINKVVRPNEGQSIAIVAEGVVQSAPTINALNMPTGPDIAISGEFTRADAVALAADLLGVKPSQVSADKLAADAPSQSLPKGLFLTGTPKANCPPTCSGIADTATSRDVAAAVARHDKRHGWVVDITLSPAKTTVFTTDTLLDAQVGTEGALVSKVGNTIELSSQQGAWTRAQANAIAGEIRTGK